MSRANVRHCAQWNIVLFSYNLTVACHICVQPTVDYIGFTRTVGVVWVCRRFEYSYLCRHFGNAVLTCRRFDHRPIIILHIGLFHSTVAACLWICYVTIGQVRLSVRHNSIRLLHCFTAACLTPVYQSIQTTAVICKLVKIMTNISL